MKKFEVRGTIQGSFKHVVFASDAVEAIRIVNEELSTFDLDLDIEHAAVAGGAKLIEEGEKK